MVDFRGFKDLVVSIVISGKGFGIAVLVFRYYFYREGAFGSVTLILDWGILGFYLFVGYFLSLVFFEIWEWSWLEW